jgi:tRNA(Arg) A34 adenosine deaminase TadA
MTESEKINRILDVVAQDIAPLTKKGVTLGNKVFGAAILNKKDLSLVLAETNNETENPLWHGEVHCLKRFYEMDPAKRPDTKDCIFIATHEPCSLCLSAITWTGFDNFWYLFSYTSTKDAFNIPHDLKILDEVFAVKNGNYRRENSFWKSHSILEAISRTSPVDQKLLTDKHRMIERLWEGFSLEYQSRKEDEGSGIPLN